MEKILGSAVLLPPFPEHDDIEKISEQTQPRRTSNQRHTLRRMR